jgi:HTH-type transcriptional repressor of NAD biosynthesis genes
LTRIAVPINATKIRSNPQKYKNYLSPEVYSYFVKRLCFLGGESSGKSTLTQLVAKTLQTECVLEYGRELWESKNGKLKFEDMLTIAETHIQRENDKSLITKDWLVCDTSPLTTLFYSLELFGKADKTLILLSQRPYDLVFLCAPDFNFIQDGTRRDPLFRDKQHQWHIKTLNERNIPFVFLEGSIESRLKSIFKILSKI